MVRDRRPLWDMRCRDYRNRDVQCQLWEEAASCLHEKINANEMKAKWHKLRESYSKSKTYIPSGSAYKTSKPHKYAEQLKFIDDIIGHRK